MNEQLFTSAVISICQQLRRIANELEKIEKKLPDRSCEDQPGFDGEAFFKELRESLEDEVNRDR